MSGCVAMAPISLLCPGAYDVVKTALPTLTFMSWRGYFCWNRSITKRNSDGQQLHHYHWQSGQLTLTSPLSLTKRTTNSYLKSSNKKTTAYGDEYLDPALDRHKGICGGVKPDNCMQNIHLLIIWSSITIQIKTNNETPAHIPFHPKHRTPLVCFSSKMWLHICCNNICIKCLLFCVSALIFNLCSFIQNQNYLCTHNAS